MSLSTAPEGTRRNDSGVQRMEFFVGAGAVADPRGEGARGHASSLGSAPARTCPLGSQPGILFGLERAIS